MSSSPALMLVDHVHGLRLAVGFNVGKACQGQIVQVSKRRALAAGLGHGESKVVDLAAGFIAGTVSRTATAPAERVKTELQLAREPQSVVAVTRRIVLTDGFRGFLQGNGVNCVKVAPQSALFFALTDTVKRQLPPDEGRAQLHSFIAGALAGVISQIIIYPFEPIKTLMTVAPRGTYRGVLDCARQMVCKSGPRALYSGVGPTLVGAIPYAGVQRWAYDWLQSHCAAYRKSSGRGERASPTEGFACGLFSSTLGLTVSYPLAVVRTRMHAQLLPSATGPAYAGMCDCIRKTVAREGVRGLFRGSIPNLVKCAPAAAINFAMYDQAKDFMRSCQRA